MVSSKCLGCETENRFDFSDAFSQASKVTGPEIKGHGTRLLMKKKQSEETRKHYFRLLQLSGTKFDELMPEKKQKKTIF